MEARQNQIRNTTTTPREPVWSIVRHYVVLFSSDNDKKDTNRVWHDGRLNHHTYNGRLVLYDESGNVEVASGFRSQRDPSAFLADDTELTLDEVVVVQVQRFERVSRTDIAPVLHATEEAAKKKRQERSAMARSEVMRGGEGGSRLASNSVSFSSPATPGANHEQARRPSGISSLDSGKDDRRPAARTPQRPTSGSADPNKNLALAFRTPFKRPSRESDNQMRRPPAQDTASESDNNDSRLGNRPVKKRLGPAVRARQSIGRKGSSS